MSVLDPNTVKRRIELLAGAASPSQSTSDRFWQEVCSEVVPLDDLSWESLNKLLLTAGFNRVSDGFFRFFTELGDDFDSRLTAWRVLAMLNFGNFRYPFRKLTRKTIEDLREQLIPLPHEYAGRLRVRDGLRVIERRDLPMLGEIAGGQARLMREKIEASSTSDPTHDAFVERYDNAKAAGLHNLYEYCAMEYMDVYVATSMRQNEDFYAVNRFVSELMSESDRLDLDKLSYFDPTQKYHPDRIVTSLVEAMMLKRAHCTVYLAQELDTLGKDSELASTLAQGKPVIAYIPREDDIDAFSSVIEEDLEMALSDALGSDEIDTSIDPRFTRLGDRIQKVLPEVWLGASYGSGITDGATYERALREFAEGLANKYEDRAGKLRDKHPLGIQVSVTTGVPNGVIVTRTVEECREVLLDVLLHELEFEIRARENAGSREVPDFEADLSWDRLLYEDRTRSIHRVVIGDQLVSNTYWNWYAVEEDGLSS